MSEYNPYFEYTRKEMLKFVPATTRRSLEVGCGSGKFSALLRQRGVECWGVEPHADAYQRCVGALDRSFHGTFGESFAHLPKSHFDVVVFNDVLEHMADPWEAVSMAKVLLSENGCIVASIPNFLYFPEFFRFMLTKDFHYRSSGTFDRTHLRFFTKASILRLFRLAGLEVEKIEGIRPYVSGKFFLFNMCTLGFFREMAYMQFAVMARIPK